MNLQHTVKTNLNITTETEILTYTYTNPTVLMVAVRASLGDATKPIAGNGNYTLAVYINNVLVTPTTADAVPTGVTQTVIVSRPIPLVQNDVISIRVTGQPADISIDTVADLYDTTSLTKTDVFGGSPVQVNHNYGGTDNLTYQTSGGVGIENATIYAYLQSDYNANNRTTQFIRGRTTTDTAGHWVNSLMLSTGQTYVLLYFKQGYYGPDAVTLAL